MKYIVVICALGLLLACASSPKTGKAKIEQGVEGVVVWLAGNQMPSVGGAPSKGKPIEREIYFCTASTKADVDGQAPLYTEVAGNLVAIVKSDAQGRYAVALPPGTYSVFTKEDAGFFANTFNGQGVIAPVVVNAGQVTTYPITVNYEAAY